MVNCIIMKFIDRAEEMRRLNVLAERKEGGFVVLWGRRRVGKTRILLEWTASHGGLYTVADQSSADLQRRYFAESVSERLPGFADVEYRDWRSLLSRLSRDAAVAGWRGPIVFDELPYLVTSSPELPSTLQRWIDHEITANGLVVAVAGSSQRMMQGIVLDSGAPLYGRAHEALRIDPIPPEFIPEAFGPISLIKLTEIFAAWGGGPRYWELASEMEGDVQSQIEHLVLNPLGPLHREPDRILIEEMPSALEVRPLLDAIGSGAHRVSEIAGRMGRSATSLSRPLKRLIEMGLVRREVPFGELERASKRGVYKIDDPFFRLWFRLVAPYRGQLVAGNRQSRMRILRRFWKGLPAEAWEEMCRRQIPQVDELGPLRGPWGPASRWWRGSCPEWDIVSESIDGRRLLLGEAKWSGQPMSSRAVERIATQVLTKGAPQLPSRFKDHEPIRALFIPEVEVEVPREVKGCVIITGAELLGRTSRQ